MRIFFFFFWIGFVFWARSAGSVYFFWTRSKVFEVHQTDSWCKRWDPQDPRETMAEFFYHDPTQGGKISWKIKSWNFTWNVSGNFRNLWNILKNTIAYYVKNAKMDTCLHYLCFWLRVAYSSPWKIWNISQPCEISWNISWKFPIFHKFLSFHATLPTT